MLALENWVARFNLKRLYVESGTKTESAFSRQTRLLLTKDATVPSNPGNPADCMQMAASGFYVGSELTPEFLKSNRMAKQPPSENCWRTTKLAAFGHCRRTASPRRQERWRHYTTYTSSPERHIMETFTKQVLLFSLL